MSKKEFKHVNDLWDKQIASKLHDDEIALLIYRSNLLGSDLRLTNYGGGNTSCKGRANDPITGKEIEVMWIKGSGGDLGTLKREDLSALYLDRLRSLENVYRGLEYEDEMVELFKHCIYDLTSKAPSIDTPLHGFLPFKHIDHLHPDAAIAIAASEDGEKITHDLFNGRIGWVDWQKPGFDLGLQLKKCLEKNPGIIGIMLGSHGIFTWGDTAYDSYYNTLEVIEKCSAFIQEKIKDQKNIFAGEKVKSLSINDREKQACTIAPILRGFCSSNSNMIGHFTDDPRVLEFINSNDIKRLGSLGTSCPDHFLRTKISPLILNIDANEDLTNIEKVRLQLEPLFSEYRKMYEDYYNTYSQDNSPSIRDSNPVIILYPGIGMFSFAKDKHTARVAAEFYINAINVMKGAEAISAYTALPRQEAFNIEYWILEEAKLQRLPKPKILSGKIALVTGSGGGIGKSIAKKFANEGACILLTDNNLERLEETKKEFIKHFGFDRVKACILDVTKNSTIVDALNMASIEFGGIDIIVNNAGLSISKSIEDHSEEDWDLLYDVLVKGQMLVTQNAIKILRKQKMGGDIINIVSKNALVSGPNNAGYGSAKAAQLHLSRLNAAELGKDKIRVNVINPDAVIAGSNIWNSGWAEGRAKAYGIAIEELPAYYAKRTLLNEIILPDDIANACFVYVGGLLNKSTGNTINVDGGIPSSFVR